MDKLTALSDDFDEIIPRIEKSLNIQFEENDLRNVETFGDFCNVIKTRLDRDAMNDCTSQQAFYKIREAICKLKSIDKSKIAPSTDLNDIFPKDTIKRDFQKLSDMLGIKLSDFRPKKIISSILAVLILASFILIFIKPIIGISGFVLLLITLKLADRFSSDLDYKTVGEFADKLATFDYAKSRRFLNTVNYSEIENRVSKIITDSLGISGELNYATRFELK